jgi:hypothetical protein
MSWLRLIEERIKAKMEDQVQQSPNQPEGDPPPNLTPPTRKENKVIHLIREMWPAYLIEILVIILGISITLAFEQWKEANREDSLEKIYLGNLLTEVQGDIVALRDVCSSTQSILSCGSEILQSIQNPPESKLTVERLNTDVRRLLGRPKFLAHDATFSDLKSSGNLHLIKDISLKNLVFGYYSRAQDIRENQDAEQMATITLSGTYFLKWFPFEDLESFQPEHEVLVDLGALSKNIEFRNNVLLRIQNRRELLNLYQAADSLGNRLRTALLKQVSG